MDLATVVEVGRTGMSRQQAAWPPAVVFARHVIRVVAAAGVVLASIAGQACSSGTAAAPASGGGRRGGGGARGAVPVVVAAAAESDVAVELEAIGNVEAYSTVSVKSQVSGQLTKVHIQDGDFVKAGDLLFTIDQRPFQVALESAQANLMRDQALLNQAEANLARDTVQSQYAQSETKRYAELFTRGLISKEQADQNRAAADAASALLNADQAAIESARATLAVGQAAIDTAKLQLDYTVIRAPLDGRTGNVSVKAGNIVSANVTELTTTTQVRPVYVTFAVPAVNLPSIKRYMAERTLQVMATPQDSDATPASGVLSFVDNTVDTSTDTIKLKATFLNPDRRLWPGQFARVVLRLTTITKAVVVPSEAVQTSQDGQFIWVVKKDFTVEMRPVTTGARVDQSIVVTRGLRTGESVVTEGQLRLEPPEPGKPGTRVQIGQGRGQGPGQGRGQGPGQGQGKHGKATS
jgi:membrane fusion protein, multidrug efflux system